MNQKVDLDAWRRDGERLWNAIQEKKLVVIFWNNPWFRFAVPAFLLLLAAVITAIAARTLIAPLILSVVALPFVYIATKYFWIGKKTGGLYSFFAENGFGVGCDADRLSIPYSAIQVPDKVTPATVNENYIILPVKADKSGVRIERKDGTDSPWDGAPYRRGIVSVVIADGTIHVRAYPNEMIVHLFCAIYPLSLFLKAKAGAESPAQRDR